MSYDRRTMDAGVTSSLLSFLRKAEEDFLGQILTMLQGNRYFDKLKVNKGVASAFLEFAGADRSEMGFDGFLAVIPNSGTDALVTLSVDSVLRGKIKFEKSYKVGVLDVRTAANIVLDNLGIKD